MIGQAEVPLIITDQSLFSCLFFLMAPAGFLVWIAGLTGGKSLVGIKRRIFGLALMLPLNIVFAVWMMDEFLADDYSISAMVGFGIPLFLYWLSIVIDFVITAP